MELPKVNYDDFYKFITSFCMITFIFGVIGMTFVMSITKPFVIIDYTGMISYSLISVTSVIAFVWAAKKWKQNQDIYDQKLSLELTKEAAECAKKISELAKDIDLSLVENMIIMSNPSIDHSAFRRNKAMELVEKIKKHK